MHLVITLLCMNTRLAQDKLCCMQYKLVLLCVFLSLSKASLSSLKPVGLTHRSHKQIPASACCLGAVLSVQPAVGPNQWEATLLFCTEDTKSFL